VYLEPTTIIKWSTLTPTIWICNKAFFLKTNVLFNLFIFLANANGKAKWQLEYSLPEAYQMPDLSVASFNALATKMLTDDATWNQFQLYYFSSMPSSNPPLCGPGDNECRVQMYCTLTSPLSTIYDSCIAQHSM